VGFSFFKKNLGFTHRHYTVQTLHNTDTTQYNTTHYITIHNTIQYKKQGGATDNKKKDADTRHKAQGTRHKAQAQAQQIVYTQTTNTGTRHTIQTHYTDTLYRHRHTIQTQAQAKHNFFKNDIPNRLPNNSTPHTKYK
jgi:hypothetical protein